MEYGLFSLNLVKELLFLFFELVLDQPSQEIAPLLVVDQKVVDLVELVIVGAFLDAELAAELLAALTVVEEFSLIVINSLKLFVLELVLRLSLRVVDAVGPIFSGKSFYNKGRIFLSQI